MNSMSSSESLNKITSSLSVSSAVTSSFASSPFAFAFDSLSEKTFKKLYDQLKTCANFTFFELHWRHDNINCCKGIMLIRVRTLFCSEMRQANSCSRVDSHQSWGREKQLWQFQFETNNWNCRNPETKPTTIKIKHFWLFCQDNWYSLSILKVEYGSKESKIPSKTVYILITLLSYKTVI